MKEQHKIVNQEPAFTIWDYIDNVDMNSVPFPNHTKLFYNGGWGKSGVVQISKNSTWYDLWLAADSLVEHSGDKHHIYIQHFAEGNSNTLIFHCGTVSGE